ncbi:Fc receptor-like protein 2 [Carcharodon carcharias]|uniref:Fc receptor-like protein 2 n=1 Tax=Carcharodon carcharias TaxID=13397 RepID=UPI001B7F4B14|nr:Fc receptor-like protein 2 [Carcharodon carcharias]
MDGGLQKLLRCIDEGRMMLYRGTKSMERSGSGHMIHLLGEKIPDFGQPKKGCQRDNSINPALLLLQPLSSELFLCKVHTPRSLKVFYVSRPFPASDPDIILEAKPRAALSGEDVSLKCSGPAGNDRFYGVFTFYRNGRQLKKGHQPNYTMKKVKSKHQGIYYCKRQAGKKETISPSISITVTDSFLALEADPPVVWEGGDLQLTCRYRRRWIQTFREIEFYRNGRPIQPKTVTDWLRIPRVDSGDAGEYHCADRNEKSEILQVHVQELFSTPALMIRPKAETTEGQPVTLICSVQTIRSNIRLQYMFYKDGDAVTLSSFVNVKRIHSASLRDSGNYLCKAANLGHDVRKASNNLSLSVRELFSEPVLTIDPAAAMYEGQSMTLTCSVRTIQPGALLRYTFYKDEVVLLESDDRFRRVEAASLSDSGNYQCEASDVRCGVKRRSGGVPLTVRRVPVSKPELVINPAQELTEGDLVSFTCSVSSGSTPLAYVFYKASSEEVYRMTSTLTSVTYKIGQVNRSDAGNYSCGVANEPTGPHLHSEAIEVAVVVPVSGAYVTCDTNQNRIPAGGQLALQCLVREGTAPRFDWYLNSRKLGNASASHHWHTNGSELAIPSFQGRHQGWYQCIATNRGSNGRTFSSISDSIDLVLLVQSHTSTITASVLPIILVVGLISLLLFRGWNKRRGNPSNAPQLQGKAPGIRPRPSSEEPASSFSENALVGRCYRQDSNPDQVIYSAVEAVKDTEVDKQPPAELVYSKVMIKPSGEAGYDGDTPRLKWGHSEDERVTYATLHLALAAARPAPAQKTAGGDLRGPGADIYENVPGQAWRAKREGEVWAEDRN